MSAPDEKPVCVDCDKSTQKEVPSSDNSTTTGTCATDYATVAACMKTHHDQVSSCVKEWKEFKECHAANPQRT